MFTLLALTLLSQDVVRIGMNYPETGPYEVQGLAQKRAAEMALEEINAAGGILGKKVEILYKDSQSKNDVTTANVSELIDKHKVSMVFGGSSSGVAIAAGKVCQAKGIPFFGTLTYSTDTTGKDARRYVFRECYDSWAAAKVLADFMNKNFKGKKYFYVTADYTWGHTTEAAFRTLTLTEDSTAHRAMLTPFPTATPADFKKAISVAKMVKPDVLVLVLFGKDMEIAVREATLQGLKASTQIVVPNLTLGMAAGGGPKVMEGVVGALPWCWAVPYKYNYSRGRKFVEDFATRFNAYPSTSAASAYTILHEYKAAAERAGSLEGKAIVKALEGHSYTLLKDSQTWREFDHQSIQTVYAVRCKPELEVLKDKFKADYFEIIGSMAGEKAFVTREEWDAVRKAAGVPNKLEDL
jgi:ABC-type branched-subunit amino acid transport system substrate-binding protein